MAPEPTPVQQTLDDPLGTVAETTQTLVDNTLPGLSETVQPVTEIVADPVGAVSGIVSNPVGAVGGLLPVLGLGGRK